MEGKLIIDGNFILLSYILYSTCSDIFYILIITSTILISSLKRQNLSKTRMMKTKYTSRAYIMSLMVHKISANQRVWETR